MSKAINFNSAQGFADFCKDNFQLILEGLFFGTRLAQLITVYENYKGPIKLTSMSALGPLAKRWSCSFDPTDDIIQFAQRTLTAEMAKVDFSICPQEFEKEFLAFKRKKGFTKAKAYDIPFEQYILDLVIDKVATEIDEALILGVANATPAAGDPLIQMINGMKKVIQVETAAGKITPVATGVLTSANIIASLDGVFDTMSDKSKVNGTDILLNPSDVDLYLSAQKTANYQTAKLNPESLPSVYSPVNFHKGGGRTRVLGLPGIPKNSIIVTPIENLVMAVDDPNDSKKIKVVEDHRNVDFMLDFKLGFNFKTVAPGMIGVNDQWA